MAKQVKRKTGYLIKNLHLSPLRRLGKSLATNNNNKKVKIFIKKIFPQLALADLSNIMGEVLITYLRVNSNITTKEMARTISRLLNNIILRLNRILNKVLKTYRLLIALQLIDIAKIYFTIGYYLRFGRVIIIFILYKEGKADYLFLGSYRPIALENTLSKILKRVIIDRMADIAKEYTLLL